MSIGIYAPEIRFKGFYGEWVEKQLSEIGSLKNGMNFDKTAMGHGHPFVNLQDVFGKNEVSDKHLGFAFSTEQQRKDYSLNEGDVLFIRSSVKPEGVGEAAVISKNMDDTTYSGFMIRFRPDIEMDVNFSRFIYSTAKIRKQILASSTSSANSNINQESLQRIKLSLPYEPEQTQIGNTFQKLDSLLNQHHQKHAKLSNIKKAMLEKMFPKQGETIPEIRFKGFSGEWKKKELRQTAIYRNGKAHEKSIDANGHYIVVNSKFVSTNGRVKKHSNEQISPLVINEICFVLSDVPNGKAIARTFLITQNNLYTLNQRIAGVTPNENSHHYFLYILLNRNPYFLKFDDGAKQTNLSVSDVESFTSLYPSVEEQTQIGNYFQKLDALINRHQQQITKLKNIKQACLSKMFV